MPLLSIKWIEAARDYVLLHTDTLSYLMRSTMEGIENQVKAKGFIRVSRSAFVQHALVQGLYKQGSYSTVVALDDGTIVRVGVKYVNRVTERLNGSPKVETGSGAGG